MALLNFFKAKPVKKELSFSEPIFVKENLSLPRQIKQLETLKDLVIPEQVAEVEQDIKKLSSGLTGEKNVAYELKNSYLPLLILQDIYLKNDDTNAQIDFIVIASFGIFVIECKKFIDDIEITNKGDFNRCFKTPTGIIYKKEGIYNPVTQNRHHSEMLKKLLLAQIPTLNTQNLDVLMHAIVVFANPKTVIRDTEAPNEIKESILKHDQLTSYLKGFQNQNPNVFLSEEEMRKISDFLLEGNIEKPTQFFKKYRFKVPVCPKCDVPMVKRIAKRGTNQGKEFWGCPNYPRCKQIVNID